MAWWALIPQPSGSGWAHEGLLLIQGLQPSTGRALFCAQPTYCSSRGSREQLIKQNLVKREARVQDATPKPSQQAQGCDK